MLVIVWQRAESINGFAISNIQLLFKILDPNSKISNLKDFPFSRINNTWLPELIRSLNEKKRDSWILCTNKRKQNTFKFFLRKLQPTILKHINKCKNSIKNEYNRSFMASWSCRLRKKYRLEFPQRGQFPYVWYPWASAWQRARILCITFPIMSLFTTQDLFWNRHSIELYFCIYHSCITIIMYFQG